jgi:hypothetical protein
LNDDNEDGLESVTLSGSASDLDGEVTSFKWTEGTTLLNETSLTPTLDFPVGAHTVVLTVTDDEGAIDTDTVLITVTEEVIVEDHAFAESLVDGTITVGDYQATWSEDGHSEVVEETISGNNKNIMRSSLQHTWQFDVLGGDAVSLHLDATAHIETDSPDQFIVSYSTDDVSYTDLLTSGGSITGSYTLPHTISGMVFVRVLDTNNDKYDPTIDSISVDYIGIRSTTTGIPDGEPPQAPTGLAAVSNDLSVQLSWNANSEPDLAGYRVYRSTTADGGYDEISSGLVPATTYTDTVPNAGTYYYVVTAVDLSGNVSGNSNEAPATATDPPPVTPSLTVSIAISTLRLSPPLDYGVATVTVTDNLGNRLSRAKVTGRFTGTFTDAFADEPTDTQGQVVFRSGTDDKKPAFDFEVTDVEWEGLTWP